MEYSGLLSSGGRWEIPSVTLADFSKRSSLIFQAGGKEVLRITPDGDLIFANASEAATVLLEQWNNFRGVAEPIGQFQGAPADPEAFG